MSAITFTLLVYGFLLGIKHAFEADHIAAVSTLSHNNKSIINSANTGMLWGFGHTLSLLIIGLIVLIFRISIPEKLAVFFEFIVGVMLIILGFNTLVTVRKYKIHFHKHKHDTAEHIHFHSHLTTKAHSHIHQPMIIGLIHGFAGSAALTLLILTTIDSIFIGLIYVLVFGIGSILGMVSISNVISWPFRLVPIRFERTHRTLLLTSSLISLAFGFDIIYQTIKILL